MTRERIKEGRKEEKLDVVVVVVVPQDKLFHPKKQLPDKRKYAADHKVPSYSFL